MTFLTLTGRAPLLVLHVIRRTTARLIQRI